MSAKCKFFFRGVYRIAVWAVCVALVVLALNVIGYLSVAYDLVIMVDSNAIGNMVWKANSYPYIGRVLWLSGLGFLQTISFITVVSAGALVAFLLFYAILYAGGYRQSGAKKC